MSRTSLINSRRTRALRDRPAYDTRLLPSPFPPGDGRSIDSPRHTCLPGLPRGCAPSSGRLAPAMCEGLYPDFVGSPEGIAPRDYSAVSPLGDSHSPRDGKESALPSLRMMERFPHTDRPQGDTPSRPADLRVWRSLAPRPLRPGHGPSIAYTPFPSFPTPIGNLWVGVPLALSVVEGSQERNGAVLQPPTNAPHTVIPMPCEESGVVSCSLSPVMKLEGAVGAGAPTAPSVFLSPSPLKALRERGTKGERVPLWGWGYPLSVGATGGSPSPL